MFGVLLAAALLPTPADAVSYAIADLQTVSEEARPWQRYIWLVEPDKSRWQGVSLAVNTSISRASVPIVPPLSADQTLIRLDLRVLAPREEDLVELVRLWNELARRDPYFYFLARKEVAVEPYIHTDGKRYTAKWQDVPVFGGHIPPEQSTLLAGMIATTGTPIVRYDRAVVKMLSTINGGLYYDFAQIKASPEKGVTDFEFFLKQFGVDLKAVERLRADRRLAITRSGITNKPRAVEYIQGPAGIVTWSEDLQDANPNPKADPTLTLLDPKVDAIEVIAIRPNGFCAYSIYDGDEKLAQSVPDVVAPDHSAKPVGTTILRPAISCIRCHGPDKGFRSATNDVVTLVKESRRLNLHLDILGDDGRVNDFDQLDKLAGKYRGDYTYFVRGRDDFSDAVFRATKGGSVSETSSTVGAIEDTYTRDFVTPEIACNELGFSVPEGVTAQELFVQITPPLPPDKHGIQIEHGTLVYLKSGIAVSRLSWEQVYIDAATRAMPQRMTLLQKLQGQKDAEHRKN